MYGVLQLRVDQWPMLSATLTRSGDAKSLVHGLGLGVRGAPEEILHPSEF